MLTELKRGLLFTVTTMLLFGGLYHAALWALGQAVFPSQVEGGLIRRDDGTVVGSQLIAQPFCGLQYFHSRPSAVDYNAASTGGSNFGPSNPEHLALLEERLAAITAREAVPASQVPSEMVTASGGGLDPHIPHAAAELQVRRVAASRGVSVEGVRALVEAHTEPPALGFLGRSRVNVLELNLALDQAFAAATRQ
jgi:potassium-transporting ATPase KdpC subunit